MLAKLLKLPIFLMLMLLAGCSGNYTMPDYNIVWTSQSEDAMGSMPVGGGNIQLNAWCEGGDVLFYIGSTDSYVDKSDNLAKLGRVRLSVTPNPFRRQFKQELDLEKSEITFNGDNGFRLTLWVDVFNPVIHAEVCSDIPVEIKAGYETWAMEKMFADQNRILVFHRNTSENPALEKLIEEQKAEPFRDQIIDPLSNLTSGGCLYADGFVSRADSYLGDYMGTPYSALRIESDGAVKSADIRIAVRIAQDDTFGEWRSELDRMIDRTMTTASQDRRKTLEWWNEFWNRSYIYINPRTDADRASVVDVRVDTTAAAWQVGRNYQLTRYMMGCSRGAKFPVLFNGGIFNVDNGNGSVPEIRNWQGCEFMAQNQRLVYWPLLKTGDSDILQPAMNLYRDRIDMHQARAREYWRIEGAAYPEGLNIYGLHSVYADPEVMFDCFYRCPDRPRTEYGHSGLIHLEYHYTSMLDFAYMLLEAARFGYEDLQDQMPVIESAVKFYDNYYKKKHLERNGTELTARGKLELYPASALELYAGAKNPTDVVSGLHALVNGVLSFPKEELTGEQYDYFSGLARRLPDIPVVEKEGRSVLPPAESWELEGDQPNMEFPQLYTLFPFEVFNFGNPQELKLAENTWLYNSKASAQKHYICWFQGGIYAAHLGRTQEAKSYTIRKFLHPDVEGADPGARKMRFPTFWSTPHFCHAPDMDHAGTAMIGLQDMLMQTPGEKIYLFPAWPADWDVKFKLHAPYDTVVEGELKNGKVVSCNVTPAHRKKDLVMMLK